MVASVRFVVAFVTVSAALSVTLKARGADLSAHLSSGVGGMAPAMQRASADTVRTSMDGVYTSEQALRGKDVFAAQCQSCHTPTFHTGPVFRARWFGRSLGELFGYMRREMPRNDPGSMSDEDYSLALAYLLRVNGMPTGAEPLAADSAELHRIRLDSIPAASSPPSSR